MLLFSLLSVALADPTKTIVENAVATPSLSTLVKVLTSPGYEPILQALSGPGNFTVFAPNDKAFGAIHINISHVDVVSQVLYYHVLPVHASSKQLKDVQFPATLMADPEFVTLGKDKAQVLGVYKTRSGGVDVNFGLPSDTARVVAADVESSNGVVHIVDRVLVFPNKTSSIAKRAGLSTLIEALVKADLVSAVDTTPGITIFAPTNQAFAAIGGISKLTKEQLVKVLTYHVVPAHAFSVDLKDGQKLKTLEGKELGVRIRNGVVDINDARVVAANVFSKNAAIHVIDKVLLPK